MDLKLATYAIYLAISVALTVWVGRTLHKNGRRFLVDVFHQDEELADSVNHLLVVGFYLVNFGFVSLALRIGLDIVSSAHALEVLSNKIGWVLLTLGGMHFFNLFVFSRLRRRAVTNGGAPKEDGHRAISADLSPAAVTARMATAKA